MCAVNAIDLLLIAAAFSGLSAVRPPTVRAVPAGPVLVRVSRASRLLFVCVCLRVCGLNARSLARWQLFGLSTLCIRGQQDATPAAAAVSVDTDVGPSCVLAAVHRCRIPLVRYCCKSPSELVSLEPARCWTRRPARKKKNGR